MQLIARWVTTLLMSMDERRGVIKVAYYMQFHIGQLLNLTACISGSMERELKKKKKKREKRQNHDKLDAVTYMK